MDFINYKNLNYGYLIWHVQSQGIFLQVIERAH